MIKFRIADDKDEGYKERFSVRLVNSGADEVHILLLNEETGEEWYVARFSREGKLVIDTGISDDGLPVDKDGRILIVKQASEEL